MPNNYSLITTALRKNAENQAQWMGSLSYTIGSKEISLYSFETEKSEVSTQIYLFLDTELFWTYYCVENNILKRFYLRGDLLVQQEYVGLPRRPWLPARSCEDAKIVKQLEQLANNCSDESKWKNEFKIITSENSSLKNNELDPFLKTFLFAEFEIKLCSLKAVARSKEEYLGALKAVLQGSIDALGSFDVAVQNDIIDLRSELYPSKIVTIVRSYLERSTINTSVLYKSAYDYCTLILIEELKQFGIEFTFSSELPQSLNTLEIKKHGDVDHELVTTLYNIYTNPSESYGRLTFTLFDKVVKSYKKHPNFQQEMNNFYAVIVAEAAINKNSDASFQFSEQELFDLVKIIEDKIKSLLIVLERLQPQLVLEMARGPSSCSMRDLATAIEYIKDLKKGSDLSEVDLISIKNKYEIEIAKKIINYVVDEWEVSTQLELVFADALKILEKADANRVKEKIKKLINFLKTIIIKNKDDASYLKINILKCITNHKLHQNPQSLTESYIAVNLYNNWIMNNGVFSEWPPFSFDIRNIQILKKIILQLDRRDVIDKHLRSLVWGTCLRHLTVKLKALRYISDVNKNWVDSYRENLEDEEISELEKLDLTYNSEFNFNEILEIIYLNELIAIEEIIFKIPMQWLAKTVYDKRGVVKWASETKITDLSVLFSVSLSNRNPPYLNNVNNLDDLVKIFIFLPWHDEQLLTIFLKKYKDLFTKILDDYHEDDLTVKLHENLKYPDVKASYKKISTLYFQFYAGKNNEEKDKQFLHFDSSVIQEATQEQFIELLPKLQGRSLAIKRKMRIFLSSAASVSRSHLDYKKISLDFLSDLLNKSTINKQKFILDNLECSLFNLIDPRLGFSETDFFQFINSIQGESIKQIILGKINDAFCKIYQALRVGQSSFLKTNFVEELNAECGEDKVKRVRKILEHTAHSSSGSRSKLTWSIMSLFFSEEWKEIIYNYSFEASAWWASSYCTRTSTRFFSANSVNQNYFSINDTAHQNWEQKLKDEEDRPGSRLHQIKLKLQ